MKSYFKTIDIQYEFEVLQTDLYQDNIRSMIWWKICEECKGQVYIHYAIF